MSAAVKPIAVDLYVDLVESPAAPSSPIAGSASFGVPRRRPGPTRSGVATLVPVSEAAAAELGAGEILVGEDAAGLHPVHVARVRTSTAGELGAEYECPVIDARRLDGSCLTYAYDDLLDVEVDR